MCYQVKKKARLGHKPVSERTGTVKAHGTGANADSNIRLEKLAFDWQGKLFIVSIFDGRIFNASPQKQVIAIFNSNDINPIVRAFHRDGTQYFPD